VQKTSLAAADLSLSNMIFWRQFLFSPAVYWQTLDPHEAAHGTKY
jgi:hypothetical protein